MFERYNGVTARTSFAGAKLAENGVLQGCGSTDKTYSCNDKVPLTIAAAPYRNAAGKYNFITRSKPPHYAFPIRP